MLRFVGVLRNWRRGWGLLSLDRPVRGFVHFSALDRFRLRCRALLQLCVEPSSRLLLWLTLLLVISSRSLSWHFDLQGLARYAVLAAPFIVLAPYFALTQYRQLGKIVRAQVHRTSGVRTASQTVTGHKDDSCAPCTSCHKSGAEETLNKESSNATATRHQWCRCGSGRRLL